MNWSGNQAGEGFEYHLLALALSAAVLIRGAGRWSVDGLLSNSFFRKETYEPVSLAS